ncbi:hypothetical protein, partial [Gemmiger formicilis]|uniref:hypothetical protein n=1 Tax=Gemmiger formicilis TaxID=745368 RepID=UPI00307AEB41
YPVNWKVTKQPSGKEHDGYKQKEWPCAHYSTSHRRNGSRNWIFHTVRKHKSGRTGTPYRTEPLKAENSSGKRVQRTAAWFEG